MTLKTGRDRHLSNLTVPKAFEAAKLIRRKCADFRQGAGYILVTHTPFQRGRIWLQMDHLSLDFPSTALRHGERSIYGHSIAS